MKKESMRLWLVAALLFSVFPAEAADTDAVGRWSEQKAWAWRQKTGWWVGCNFLPSCAINQLEMFQADTFDPQTLDRELGWAQSLGFNSIRVYLHHLLWEQDANGFLGRLDGFLALANRRGIGVVFVLFDSCWDPFPKLGPQRPPKPHVHNSGWVQTPGAEALLDPTKHPALEAYVTGVVGRFRSDPRVQAWDIWNEPDNMNRPAYVDREPADKVDLVLPLLKKAFDWARRTGPAQPLTSGVWMGTWPDPNQLSPTEQIQLSQSDVISFHNYSDLGSLKDAVDHLSRYRRPLLCTEYMSRGNGSLFDPNLGYLKSKGVAAYNWGLVDGKSQTIYPWDSWTKAYDAPPVLWFHDIFRRNGQPYQPQETAYIQAIIRSDVLFNGADLAGWRQPLGDWQVVGTAGIDPSNPEAFSVAPGFGVLLNGPKGKTVDLMTETEYGDVDLHVEFCIPKHSNSGIYLQGRYEIQVYDSHGVAQGAYPGIECGGIYPRWIQEQNVDGHSPIVNASKAPGEWQSFDIQFRAPRFDNNGRKIANARMVRVTHNGHMIHENVELKGPTRSARWEDEKTLGPILLQGDHGPVAYRNLRINTIHTASHQDHDGTVSKP
ncbi:MAG TPA: DUF1080 domain-containing protein [Candidatus Paceibacterota bacterium]|nr:DUF1080 domain-containing protein [Verrucomicrobiota bacterium]HRY46705.1 DUF1080 domain-containing protein [Candidatus Paceibacterota bacterium]